MMNNDAMLKTQQQGPMMLGRMWSRGHLTMEQLKSALDGYKKEGVSGRQFNIVGKMMKCDKEFSVISAKAC